jgi:hypothetical protein
VTSKPAGDPLGAVAFVPFIACANSEFDVGLNLGRQKELQ